MKRIRIVSSIAFPLLLLAAADIALANDLFILATGRRDPRIYAIDFNAALKRQNNNTSNAIVSRSRVHPDRLDGTLVGDPANIVLSEDRRTAYVINHHGPVNNAEFLQHGGRGSVSVMDVRKMLRPEFDDTDRAVERNYDSGYFGAVGLLVLPELLLVSHSENWLTEDGSNRISIIDRKTGGRRGQIEIADRPTSKATASRSSTWIAPAPARSAPRRPASGSGPMIPTGRHGRSRSPGRPTDARSSWRITARTMCRSSTCARLSPMSRARKSRAFRSPAPQTLMVRSVRAAPKAPRSRWTDAMRSSPAGRASIPTPRRAGRCG